MTLTDNRAGASVARSRGTGATAGTRFPCFDGLRAIAALTVVGVHTAFASGFTSRHHDLGRYTSRLEIGVEVFFVISGFLLYRPFAVAHLSDRDPPAARAFWSRRLKRIVPAYWAAFLIISYVIHADQVRHTWDAPLIYLGFAQIYFPNYIVSGIDQAWSLCTEMSFYLMLPLYAAAMAGLGRRAAARTAGHPATRHPAALHPATGPAPGRPTQLRVELQGLLALTVISFAYRIPVLLSQPGPGHSTLTQAMPSWLPGYLDQFALGMLLAVASVHLAVTGRRPAWLWHRATPWICWTLAAAAFWAVSNIGLHPTPLDGSPLFQSLLRELLYGAFAFLLVLPAVFGSEDQGAVRRLLRWRPLVLVGVVSYGVYLWHETWMNVFLSWFGGRLFVYPWGGMLLVVTLLAVATATLSYRLVERPILRTGRPLDLARAPRAVGAGGPAHDRAHTPIGAPS